MLLAILQSCGHNPQMKCVLLALEVLIEAGRWFLIVSVRWGLCPRSVSICNRTERTFTFTEAYFRFDLVLGRKVSTKLFLCIFLYCLCLLCARLCVILFSGGMQNHSLYPCFLHSRQWCVLNGHFRVKCQPPQFQQADKGFYVLSLVTLSSVVFERCWLQVLWPVPTVVPCTDNWHCGGARGVVVIAIGNDHGDTSSNPGRYWLHFT